MDPSVPIHNTIQHETAGPENKPLLLLGNGASELIDLVVRQAKPGCVCMHMCDIRVKYHTPSDP